jgi:hypothetical protein
MGAKQNVLQPGFCLGSACKYLKESQGAVNFLIICLWAGATSLQKHHRSILEFERHPRRILEMLAKPSSPTLGFCSCKKTNGVHIDARCR